MPSNRQNSYPARHREWQNEHNQDRNTRYGRNRHGQKPYGRQENDIGASPPRHSLQACRERETKRRRGDMFNAAQVGSSSHDRPSARPVSPRASSRVPLQSTVDDRRLADRRCELIDSERLVNQHAKVYEAYGARYDRERGLHATNRDVVVPSGNSYRSHRRARHQGNLSASRPGSTGTQQRWHSEDMSPPPSRFGRRSRKETRRRAISQGEDRIGTVSRGNRRSSNAGLRGFAADSGDSRIAMRIPREAFALIPPSWRLHKSKLQEWERMQADILERGDTADSLVFKLFHQLFLSPMNGMAFSSLSAIDSALTAMPQLMYSNGQCIIGSSNFPENLLSILSHPLGELLTQCIVHPDRCMSIRTNSRSKDVENGNAHDNAPREDAVTDPKNDNYDVVELLRDNILYCFQHVIAPAHENGCFGGRIEYLWRGNPQFKHELTALRLMDARRNVAVVFDPLYNHLMRALHRNYHAPTERHLRTSHRR